MKPRVLVVQASLTVRMHLGEALEAAGFEVRLCADAAEARAAATPQVRFSLLLLDLTLPDADGALLARELQASLDARVPVLMLANPAEREGSEAGRASGGDFTWVDKPFEPEELLARVRALAGLGAEPLSGAYRGARLLVVDDSRTQLEALAEALGQEGYEVTGARSGEEALALLGARPVDCVLLDMNMPGLTGEETCHRLKATPALRRVPVILMTAREDRQAIVDALNAGADDFVPKSNDVAVLTARLRAQLRRKQSEDEKERIQQELAQKQLEAAQAASDRELAETRAVLLKDLEQKNEELSRATRQAIQSEARFRLLVEGVKDYAIFMMDTQGRIESWNPGAENITGYRSEEMVGQPFSLLYPPEDVQASRPQQTLGHATTHGVCEEEAPRVRKDGTRFWAEAALRAVRDKAGQLVGFVEVIRDVTERKRAQEEREDLLRNLQQALTTRDDFLSIASHELKTPLTSLRLQLDSLERIRAKAPPEVADQLHRKADVLRRQIGRLTQLINNLLDVSNISSRRLKLELEDVELSALVREVAGRFEEELERAGCRLVLDTPADAVVGRWDRLHVDQVITNLLSNALKYGPGRPIEISVACDNGLARLRIRDHGIGIHPDHQRRVFERFERAVSDRHYGGFGLGLWISRQIVEGLGGSIAVQSQPGEGSAFTVALPLAGPGADLLPLDFTETVSARQ